MKRNDQQNDIFHNLYISCGVELEVSQNKDNTYRYTKYYIVSLFRIQRGTLTHISRTIERQIQQWRLDIGNNILYYCVVRTKKFGKAYNS